MFYAKTQDVLSLLLSVQYTHAKTIEYDYSTQPRPCHNLVFMLEGEALIQASGKTVSLKAGDILYIPKNTTYKSTWTANPKVVFHSLHFSFQNACDPFINTIMPVQRVFSDRFDELYHLLKEIERYQFSKTSTSFLALSAFYGICAELFKNVEAVTAINTNKTLSPAIAYIEQNYTKSITVETLANLCFLSPSRFYYLFKRQTGESPIVYKNKIAVQSASRELLLRKDLPIKTVAERHGFPNVIYFERLFKKITGKTPSLYRKEETLL